MLSVEPRTWHKGEEELTAVCVSACVGHGEQSLTSVLHFEVLIRKPRTVDALTTHSVSVSEITSLSHELGDDSVEGGSLVVQRLANLTDSFLAGAESSEILSSLWHLILEQLEDDSPSLFVGDGQVEEHFRVRHLVEYNLANFTRYPRIKLNISSVTQGFGVWGLGFGVWGL